MSIGERIKHRRLQLGYSQDDLARLLGYKSRSSINKIELGVHNISQSKIVAFADKLETTPLYLLGLEDENGNEIRPNIDGIKNIQPIKKVQRVPLLGRIACGDPITAEENIEGWLILPDNVKADFCLTCKGDSMIDAGIEDGDTVYIKAQPMVDNGEIAAVVIDGEATLKRVKYINPANVHDGVILLPENPNYNPIILNSEHNDVYIAGKMTAVLKIC